MTTSDIVAKLWNLCNILKDDGVTYHQYVTELTYLLFLKMAQETGTEGQLPAGHRWADLEARAAPDRLEFYKILLIHLGSHGSTLVQEIFANASSFIKKPATLSTLVSEINKLDWYSARQEGMGDLYEGLLEKNANEKKSGAGQYFTPRVLIDSMVAVMKPTLADVIQDPAAGTGGFLIAANHYLRDHHEFDALILFNEGGDIDKLGRGWIWEGQIERCSFQNHVFRARLYDNANQPKYISWWGNFRGLDYFLRSGKQTTNLASINKSMLSNLPILLPPPEEQTEIVRRVETLFTYADGLETRYAAARARVDKLTPATLAKAFRGELVPQYPDDEPASALLDRIRTVRGEDAPRAARRGRETNTV